MKSENPNVSKQLSEIQQDLLTLTDSSRSKASSSSIVEEPGVGYVSFFANRMAIIQVIQNGLPFSLFEKIKNISPFSEMEWADFLGVSSKTLQRQKKEANFSFKPIQSEKILELAEVVNLGLSAFDTSEQFYSWLKEPSFALGKMKPIDLIRDSYGKELVMDELNRIEFGIFA
jgi:putative toxin-antitoxin system antitoxin component (TIGR02293 family)